LFSGDELMVVVAPKPMWDAGIATTKQVEMGGSLTTPTALQMTDVNPNRCGEPVNPLKGTLAPLGRGGGQTREMRGNLIGFGMIKMVLEALSLWKSR